MVSYSWWFQILYDFPIFSARREMRNSEYSLYVDDPVLVGWEKTNQLVFFFVGAFKIGGNKHHVSDPIPASKNRLEICRATARFHR